MTLADSYRSLEALLEDQPALAGKMLAVSLAMHLCLLALVTGLRLSPAGERPLTSYQVSLVSMPRPVRSAPPPAVRSAEPDRPREPAEPPPLRATEPAATPPVRPSASKVAPDIAVLPPRKGMDIKPRPKTQMQDVLRTIELPPEAPKLGKLSPVSPLDRVEATKRDIAKLLDPLSVPEMQALPPTPIELSVAAKEAPSQAPSRPASRQPTEQATTAPIVQPTTAIQVPGIVPALNRYLALVQSRISSQWVAPQVDLTGRSLQVVIKFRLDRSGVVSHVTIEKSSGNEYYDLAGTRAVLSANPLPPFPQDMSDTTVDAHFSFTVGDQAG
ncbi:MAG: TonB family protein [Nitrospiraceae bacterium]